MTEEKQKVTDADLEKVEAALLRAAPRARDNSPPDRHASGNLQKWTNRQRTG